MNYILKIKVEFIFISFLFSKGNFNFKENITVKWRKIFFEGLKGNIGFWKTRRAIQTQGVRGTYSEIPNCAVSKSPSNFYFIDI